VLKEGGWLAPRSGRLTTGNNPLPAVQEAGWGPRRFGQLRKISTLLGFDPQTIQLIANRYTDYANPVRTTLLCDDKYGRAVFTRVFRKYITRTFQLVFYTVGIK
jgi:hypothetical protein